MSRLFIDGAIAVTGAAGALGKVVVRRLADEGLAKAVVALDLRPDPTQDELSGVTSLRWDVRDKGLDQLLREHEVKAVVHLASIVDGRGVSRQLAWDVDVLGTQRVIDACLAAGVEHLTVTSSGAAYGYHADNPEWLTEELPCAATTSSPTATTRRWSRRCSPRRAGSTPS